MPLSVIQTILVEPLCHVVCYVVCTVNFVKASASATLILSLASSVDYVGLAPPATPQLCVKIHPRPTCGLPAAQAQTISVTDQHKLWPREIVS
jgi:hypothetical protein